MAASVSGIKAGKAFVLIEAIDRTGMVLRRVSRRFDQWAGRIAGIGRSLITKGLMALTPAALSSRTFASFDDSLRKVEARSQGTAAEMNALREEAKYLGRTTSHTASQIGELMAKLAQKGYSRSQILQMTKDVRNLARAAGEGGLEDTVVAADAVSGALKAYQMEATKSTHVADLYAATVNKSNYSLQDLLDSMAYAGPVAKQYNVSLEDTLAVLGSLRDLNIDASMAGTAFRNMLVKLSDEAGRSTFNKSLQELTGSTIDMVDAAGNLRNLPDILFSIGEATRGLGTAQRGELLANLFGLRALVPAAAMSDSLAGFSKLRDVLSDVDGVAQRTSETMDAGLGGTFRRIKSAVEGTAIAIGESLEKGLIQLGEGLASAIVRAVDWINANRGIVVLATLAAAGVVFLGVSLLGVAGILKVAAIATGILGTALIGLKAIVVLLMGLLTSPFTVAVGLAVAAIVTFSSTIRSAIGNVVSFLGDKFSALGETLKGTFKGILDALAVGDFSAAWDITVEGMTLAWLEFIEAISAAWSRFAGFFVTTWTKAYAKVRQAQLWLQGKLAAGILESAKGGGISGWIARMMLGDLDIADIEKEKIRQQLELKYLKEGRPLAKSGESQAESRRRQMLEYTREMQKVRESLKKRPPEPPTPGTPAGKTWPRTIAGDVQREQQRRIAEVGKEAEESLATFRKATEKAAEERKAEITQRKARLQELLDAIAKRREAEEQAAKVGEAIAAPDFASKIDDLVKNIDLPQDRMAQQMPASLEKGTETAAKQAYENQQRLVTEGDNVIATKLDEQTMILRDIRHDLVFIEGVG